MQFISYLTNKSTPFCTRKSITAMIAPNTTDTETTAAVCFASVSCSGQMTLAELPLSRPLNQLFF
mgnify:CR=1 FL=1